MKKTLKIVLVIIVSLLLILLIGKWVKTAKDKAFNKKLNQFMADYEKLRSPEETAKDVFSKCSEAVVHISTQSSSITSIADASQTGYASGFFVSADGYICTNEHVVGTMKSIRVTCGNGKTYDAKIIGIDKENDIAVLKIEPEKKESFKYLKFSSSDELFVGQSVYAIGNPFGYDKTLSCGCISGLSRPVRNERGEVLLGMIQTDAAINPGNSGGPLLDSEGNVIGVCASIYSSSGTSQGLNFAVSSNDAVASVQDIIKYGKVNRGWLDIVPVVLTQQIVDYASLKTDSGILVSQVVAGGKAESAGLKGGTQQVLYGNNSVIFLGGDIITKVNGTEVKDFSDLFTALSNTRPKDKIEVIVNRNGNTVKLKIELVERTSALVSYANR